MCLGLVPFVSSVFMMCLKPAFISVALVWLRGLRVGGMSSGSIISTRALFDGCLKVDSVNTMVFPSGICARIFS